MISVFSKNYIFRLAVFLLCVFIFAGSIFCQPPSPINQSQLQTFAAELIKAADETGQLALLNQNPNFVTDDLFENVMRSGIGEQTRGNFRQALAFYLLGKIIAEKKGDQSRIARATREAAIAEFQLNGNFNLAFERFQKSLLTFESLGERPAVAKTLNNLGILHLSQGEYQKAVEYFQQSLAQTDGENEKPELARTLNNMGIVQRRLGNYAESLAAFTRSLEITEKLKMNRQSAHTLNNMQAVYKEQGNYRQALFYLQKALAFEELRGDQDFQARLIGNTGEIYFLQGDYEPALGYFRQSLQIGEKIGDKWLNHQLELKISRVYKLLGNFEEALKYAERSLNTSQQIGDQPGMAASLTEIGNIKLSADEISTALEFFNRGLRINETIGDRAAAASSLLGIAAACHKQNQFEKSAAAARRSEEFAVQAGNAEILWQARSAIGRALRSAGKIIEAQKYFEDAVKIIEALRLQTAGRERERELFFESKLEPFHQLIELFIERKNFVAALEIAERAKGRVLLDVLENGRTDITKAMTSDEQSKEQALRGAIIALNMQLTEETARAKTDEGKINALEAKLRGARANYEAFQTNLFVSRPEIKLRRGNTEPFELKRAANWLPAGTAFLEFIITGENVFLAVAKKQGAADVNLKIHRLALSPQQLGTEVKNFRDLLASRNLDYEETARKLFDALLKPAAAEFGDVKTLCIIPDGFLWELPFQALIGADGKFLIEKQAVFYASSLSVLQAAHKPVKPNSPRSLLALGNPLLIDSPNIAAPENSRNTLPASLSNAEKEVRQLGVIYGAEQSLILSGQQATETAFKGESGKFGVLHLATHAVLDDANPMYSRILLSSGSAEERANEDGMLETWEILGMDLRAELVVLSACETGRGRIGAGEGVIGLSWAFFVAGTPTALVSQWKVDSASTTELMISFHRNLKSSGTVKASAATALRSAALALLKDKRYRHPFYWAGFVLVGNGLN